MARKRERVDIAEAQHLFKQRLNALLGERPRPLNAALDMLIGTTPEAAREAPSQATQPATLPVQTRRGRETPREKHGGRKRTYFARTVYLEPEDLREIDALAEEWGALTHRHVSRSEVLRQAIRWLRGSVAPPPFAEGE